MTYEPKAFSNTPEHVNEQVEKIGIKIFDILIKETGNSNTLQCDIALNSLCFAMLRLMTVNVVEDNRPILIQVIYKILMNNYKDDLDEST